jgi:hypothetical protein
LLHRATEKLAEHRTFHDGQRARLLYGRGASGRC